MALDKLGICLCFDVPGKKRRQASLVLRLAGKEKARSVATTFDVTAGGTAAGYAYHWSDMAL